MVGFLPIYLCYLVILVWYFYRIVVDIVDIYKAVMTAGGQVHTCVKEVVSSWIHSRVLLCYQLCHHLWFLCVGVRGMIMFQLFVFCFFCSRLFLYTRKRLSTTSNTSSPCSKCTHSWDISCLLYSMKQWWFKPWGTIDGEGVTIDGEGGNHPSTGRAVTIHWRGGR